MPAMLEQMVSSGHDHRSQLGWGASLKSHWEPDVPINGFEQENAHPRYQDALAAVRSGGFDATFVGLTQDQADLACRRLQARAIQCFTMGP